MANVFSLCNDIEQFLQQNDQNSINQFINWLKQRLKLNENISNDLIDKSMINTSQIFICQCGHRYSLHFAITKDENDRCCLLEDSNDDQCKSKQFKTDINNQKISRLHTHETSPNHYSMHQQGYTFCKRCFQFQINSNNDQTKLHKCEQEKIDQSSMKIPREITSSSLSKDVKFDELYSLEQLIPPETIEQQQQDCNTMDYVNDHESLSSARITRFGLPKLTDSLVEIIHPDGKRQFRCPLCFNSYVNRSGLNRHYITHSSQDLWKVECQFCGKRYSRKDSLKHHMKTQHAQFIVSNEKNNSFYHRSNERIFRSYKNLSSNLFDINNEYIESISSSSNEKQQIENDDVVLVV